MLSDETLYLTVEELGEQIRSRKISPVELTESYLARLERYGPKLSAVATVTRELALEQARAAEREIAAGKSRGPLHGIPYGAKDLLATRGIPTTWGAPPFRNQVFDYDATVVRKLREAGAILVAKLAMIELAGGCGYSNGRASLQGGTRNPFHQDYWAGGSSSGPAASVAAGLVGFAIGSETLGSIVSPASYCACAGLRPTYGRVSRHGAMALSWTMDKLGPLCRSAADCGLVLSAIAGSDPLDPASLDANFYWWPPKPESRAGRSARPLAGKRIAAVPLDPAHPGNPEGERAFSEALRVLRDLGARVDERELPDFAYTTIATTLYSAEAASIFRPLVETGKIFELVDEPQQAGFIAAMQIPACDYLDACRLRTEILGALGRLFESCDIIAAQTLPNAAFRLDTNFVPVARAENRNLTSAGNVAGLPSISVPCGFTQAENLPLGIQFCADATREDAAIECAIAYQSATKWHLRHPAAL